MQLVSHLVDAQHQAHREVNSKRLDRLRRSQNFGVDPTLKRTLQVLMEPRMAWGLDIVNRSLLRLHDDAGGLDDAASVCRPAPTDAQGAGCWRHLIINLIGDDPNRTN
jgi:hypothetical protein